MSKLQYLILILLVFVFVCDVSARRPRSVRLDNDWYFNINRDLLDLSVIKDDTIDLDLDLYYTNVDFVPFYMEFRFNSKLDGSVAGTESTFFNINEEQAILSNSYLMISVGSDSTQPHIRQSIPSIPGGSLQFVDGLPQNINTVFPAVPSSSSTLGFDTHLISINRYLGNGDFGTNKIVAAEWHLPYVAAQQDSYYLDAEVLIIEAEDNFGNNNSDNFDIEINYGCTPGPSNISGYRSWSKPFNRITEVIDTLPSPLRQAWEAVENNYQYTLFICRDAQFNIVDPDPLEHGEAYVRVGATQRYDIAPWLMTGYYNHVVNIRNGDLVLRPDASPTQTRLVAPNSEVIFTQLAITDSSNVILSDYIYCNYTDFDPNDFCDSLNKTFDMHFSVAINNGQYCFSDDPDCTTWLDSTNYSTTKFDELPIQVKHTSSATPGDTVVTELAVGNRIYRYESTVIDAIPDVFSFTTAQNIALSTNVISNEVTINGINVPIAISITGGSYSINATAFTNQPGIISQGDKLRLQLNSSAQPAAATVATVSLGTSNETFTVTTVGAGGTDTDNDGMSDIWEVQYGLNPLIDDSALDSDSDGLTNLQEFTLGSNPTLVDTDNDGMSDKFEVDNGYDPTDGSDCPSWMCGSSKVWLYQAVN